MSHVRSFVRMLRREQRQRARQSRRRPPPLRVAVVGDQRTIQRWLLKNAMISSSRDWYLLDGRMIVYGNDEAKFLGHRIEEVVVLYGADTAAIVSAHARKVT